MTKSEKAADKVVDLVGSINFILSDPYGTVDREYADGTRSIYHTLYEPLDDYIKIVEKIWEEGRSSKFTPVKIYTGNFSKLVWEKKSE